MNDLYIISKMNEYMFQKIDETIKRVDIHTNLQVKEILHVEG